MPNSHENTVRVTARIPVSVQEILERALVRVIELLDKHHERCVATA